MSLTLPPNVRIDDNTGLYIITNSKGQTFRVNAQDQAQLNAYVQSVNTNTPTTITAINPATGLPVTSGFNPEFILNQRKELEDFFALQRETKQKTGIVGNKDGTYTDLKSNPTVSLTLEQAQERIAAAGLPPNALASVTPKNSPSYFAATRAVDETTNTPSSLLPSPQPTSTQPPPAINSDNLNLSASSDPNTNPGNNTQTLQPLTSDNSILDANSDPQSQADDDFANQQRQLAIENGEPQPVAALEALEAEINAPLSEPPGVPQDEFGGVDEAIARNANSLQEPPQLSEEEADQALTRFNQEFIENEEPPDLDTNDDAALGLLGINTDLPTEASLGELGLNTDKSLSGSVINARSQAGLQAGSGFSNTGDWRVRLKLAPGSNYLYNAPASERGILAPLNSTKGVIFPYTPSITVNYTANYDPASVTHSNYKILQYQNSSVDNIQIMCEFTAQDTNEANYLLAVIHFFRSVTKMFYGKDQNPKRGTPPPLCYLEGLGSFQFDMHPLVVTSFSYNLPTDVDYIRAMPLTSAVGADVSSSNQGTSPTSRLPTTVAPGGVPKPAAFSTPPTGQSMAPTYVPTKIQLQISCMPVVSRKDISDNFSLKEYGKGTLLQGSKRNSGGIW